MHIEKGTFTIDNFEKVELEGNYEKSLMTNELYVSNPDVINHRNIPYQAVCVKANVLYRTDTENVSELIKVIMRYTHDPCDDLDLDKSVQSGMTIVRQTISARRQVLFGYKSKVFVTFGGHIGYDGLRVNIHRVNAVSDGGSTLVGKVDDDSGRTICSDESHLDDKITNDDIVLNGPDCEPEKNSYDYTYAFMIYDKMSGVLDAFGLYR